MITTSQLVSAAVGTLLPIVVALITARVADGATKALTLLALAALSGVLTELGDALAAGTPWEWQQSVYAAVLAYVVAVASHFGLWKPAAVTGSGGGIQTAVPGGIGGRA